MSYIRVVRQVCVNNSFDTILTLEEIEANNVLSFRVEYVEYNGDDEDVNELYVGPHLNAAISVFDKFLTDKTADV